MKKYEAKEKVNYDFMGLLLCYLAQQGITRVNKDDFKNKLLFYSDNDKYKILFNNVKMETDAFDKMIVDYLMFGSLRSFGDDLVVLSNDPLRENYEKNSNSDYCELLKQMVMEYKIHDDIEKSYKNNIIIYNTNPNRLYKLEKETNSIVTDGNISLMLLETLHGENIKFGPESIRKFMIQGASYVLKKTVSGNTREMYTELSDYSTIKDVIDNSNNVDNMTKQNEEKPYIYHMANH